MSSEKSQVDGEAPENRHLSKFQTKIILCLEKQNVSGKAPQKSPFVQTSDQNHFVVGKIHVSSKAPEKSPFVKIEVISAIFWVVLAKIDHFGKFRGKNQNFKCKAPEKSHFV